MENTQGCTGTYGPNDGGYIDNCIRKSAQELVRASELYSQGHYPHSNAKVLPEDHPLRLALKHLSDYDKEMCIFANEKHNPELFQVHEPSEESQHRWDKTR